MLHPARAAIIWAGFVLQGGVGLEPAEVGPAFVEAGGHAQVGPAERARRSRTFFGEVQVAPAAGRQRLDFHLLLEGDLLLEVGQRAGVEEDARRRAGLLRPSRAAGPCSPAPDGVGVGLAVVLAFRVQPGRQHLLDRVAAEAGLVPAHVEEDAVHRPELPQHLARLLDQVFLVRAGHVQDLPPRRQRPRPDGLAVLLAGDPFRVVVGGVLVALDADVDRGADALAVQRLDLLAQQVEARPQARVPLGPAGVVVEVAVVALGEDGDAVDVGLLESLGRTSAASNSRPRRGSTGRCGSRGGPAGRGAVDRGGVCFTGRVRGRVRVGG